MEQNFMPWVEFYRPVNFDDIILDPLNKQIFKNIIETGYFPNLLFYGPPGTGKTTTIINLVNSYQEKLNQKNKELMIHLNASDERGIDIIRSQINQFVNSKTMFNHGMKFVILDEVDYMTKNAQQALRYLLQNFSNSVRFCLICNYISRIDEGLQNEFLKLRFNQLPKINIINFLNNISIRENLNLNQKSLNLIQTLYKSDIRSMINVMQSNQNIKDTNICIIDNSLWEQLFNKIKNGDDLESLILFTNEISYKYNMDKKNIIKDFLNYIIRNKEYLNIPKFFNFVENIIHFEECNNNHYVTYSLIKLSTLLKELF
jgi:DNA polymerase III delta prime subunit